MLQVLKYIVLFLLGYKVIKMLFREEQPEPQKKKMPQDRMRVNNNPAPNPTPSNHYTDAEVIDYEEVK